VARTDEPLGGSDEADGAAEVHAARGERDPVVVLVDGLLVDLRIALAHVGDRVAGLADALDDREDLGGVRRLAEVRGRPDRLPVERDAAEQRAQGEAERGERERRRRDTAGAVRDHSHEPASVDGLAFEGARDLPILGVFGFGSFFVSICHLRLRSTAAKPN
jgi:hypothetical protein